MKDRVRKLVEAMTLEEKASLCSGADFWHTKAIERLGIPSVMVSDGPHGLRKQDENADHLGVNESIKAVCFPAGCALASSFDKALVKELGETLGNECQAENLSTILGPAVNIKRSPLCGRNFEYLSEDPYLASKMAGSLIEGIQSKHVGTSIKHFACNNQETRRMSVSSNVDERALHEIYLGAFEYAIKEGRPWTVMSSYNKVNGTYVGETKALMSDVLRGEFGFDGYVMSDWGAVNDRVPDLEAGLDLQMPGPSPETDEMIVEAVRSGRLAEAVVDQAVARILNIVYRFVENRDVTAVFDRDADHEKAADIAGDCIVLLKNEGILPLKKEQKVAFIGKYAQSPRFQGGGSSHINAHRITSALDAAKGAYEVSFAKGFDDNTDEIDEELFSQALAVSREADVAVLFLGLPDAFESEGFDRVHMRLPDCQNALVEEVAKVQKHLVVVLHNGSPIEMPWLDKTEAVVEAYLCGQAVGKAVVRVLYGEVNPSGHVAETFPRKLEDNPSFLNFPGTMDDVNYREGIFVGYRYYEKKRMEVLFPFGHGLSYTTFSYSNLRTDKKILTDKDSLEVCVDVKNTGSREGKCVVQLYVGKKDSEVVRAVKELKGFEKINLKPGETKCVTFTLHPREFSYYEERIHDWFVEGGVYELFVGESSADVRVKQEVTMHSKQTIRTHYTLDTPFCDIMKDEKAMAVFGPLMEMDVLSGSPSGDSEVESAAINPEMKYAMMQYMPLRGIVSFSSSSVTLKQLEQLIETLEV
ncbi:MAG: glycoside hydrolase family 3 C-terminal domain-containing protein [Sphaerochaetaceae bacterium]